MLYPIKFKPILKERIWGGPNLGYKNMDDFHMPDGIGESWELSGLEDNLSQAVNGELAGNNMEELLEVYMGDLVGDRAYDRFGNFFPVLLKMIDTSALLSVQVHPGDALAKERHGAYGKEELWYIVDCAEDAVIYLGLKEGVTKEQYLDAVKRGTVEELLNKVPVHPGEFYEIPTGAVHALGANITVVEMQEPSDITYRIFDWKRKDAKGKMRELHTELAIDAIDFDYRYPGPIVPGTVANAPVRVAANDYFVTSVIRLDGTMEMDLTERDAFTAYVCVEGTAYVVANGVAETLDQGEVVLIPNAVDTVTLSGKAKILEFTLPEYPEED